MNLELWKKRKKELKLNYSELAELSGVSKRTVEDLFRGFTKNPRIDKVEAIEKTHGIGGDYWTEEERLQVVVDNFSVIVTADEHELLMLYREIGKKKGEQGKQTLMNVAEALLK